MYFIFCDISRLFLPHLETAQAERWHVTTLHITIYHVAGTNVECGKQFENRGYKCPVLGGEYLAD